MARELSKYGLSVTLNTENTAVDIDMFERDVEADSKTVIEQRSFTFNDLPGASAETDGIAKLTSLYGLSKILQDRTSAESKNRGRLASMDEVWARLQESQWEKERESSGPILSVEVEALAAIKGVSVGDIQKALRNYTDEQRQKILASEPVQARAEEIRVSRASEEESGGTSLDDLMAA